MFSKLHLLTFTRFSNSQSVLLASAVRIGHSLGLHRLSRPKKSAYDPDGDNLPETIQKEVGRRVWQQLATQDWFSVPFSETYCMLKPFERTETWTDSNRRQPSALYHQATVALRWRDYAATTTVNSYNYVVRELLAQSRGPHARSPRQNLPGAAQCKIWSSPALR